MNQLKVSVETEVLFDLLELRVISWNSQSLYEFYYECFFFRQVRRTKLLEEYLTQSLNVSFSFICVTLIKDFNFY